MSQKLRRRRFIRTGAIAGTALIAGCSGNGGGGGGSDDGNDNSDGNDGSDSDDDSDNSDGNSGNDGPPTVALLVPSLEFTFFARMQNAFDQAVSDGAIASDSTFSDAGNSQSQQVSDVENAVSNEVDFIMISAITAEGITSAIQEANEADIPVVAIDRNIAEGDTISYVASDNVQLGRRSTELCLSFMEETSDQDTYNIVQLEGTPGASVTNDRGEGFQNAVSSADNLEQLATQTGEFSTQEALNVMEDFITEYDDEIDGVFCQNDLMALGAHQALQNADISVPVTGIDGTEAWVERFSDNEYYGTLAQLPEEMVTTGIDRGKAYLAGEEVEEAVVVEGLEVTQENGSDYLNQYFG